MTISFNLQDNDVEQPSSKKSSPEKKIPVSSSPQGELFERQLCTFD